MLQGIHLTLLIGPAVPAPAPQAVMDAVTSVQVTSSKDTSGFQLVFAISKNSLLLTTLLPAGYFDPISTRVIVVATVGGMPQVLMDGVVTRQELAPSSEPGQSTLTITGEDLSALMDLIDLTGVPFPAMTEVARVYLMLAKYAAFGIVPAALPPIPPDIPIPTDEIPTQRGTDRAYIRQLAGEAGYVFYVEPGPLPGQSVAYFGPDVRVPVPQPALNINMDAQTNVESLSFSFDGLQKKIVLYSIMDPVTHKVVIPIPVPNLSVLRPPLGVKVPIPWRLEQQEGAAKNNPAKAAQEILGILFNASDAITASGSLDVLRYGRVLRSRMLVGVRGAGASYDGLYYVNSVTHNIKRGEYKQSFQLSRDGQISLTPKVPA
ncbi:MAG: hypothetical protein KGL99_17015 [Burkholderiales bacterium]|nr:hypothetical protein [Burkholderiales bacterium]MDE2628847.1 hypothetical protein [Burkholderiales bacterium]